MQLLKAIPYIIDLPKIEDDRGNLTFAQNPSQIPFTIKRIFWVYSVPGGKTRGGHAYNLQEEVIIALSGSFDIIITDSNGDTTKFSLNRSYQGLYLPPLTWRHIENFSTNALSLHLSSTLYTREDYFYDFDEFKKVTTTHKNG